MLRRLPIVMLVWILMLSYAPAQENQKLEEITGVVVAYDTSLFLLPCFDSICWDTLIVRVTESDAAKPRYIKVSFRYQKGKFPNRLVEQNKQYRFRLERAKEYDSPLNEFVAAENEKGEKIDVKLPMWKMVSGAESERLPFGETLPSYILAVNVSELIGGK